MLRNETAQDFNVARAEKMLRQVSYFLNSFSEPRFFYLNIWRNHSNQITFETSSRWNGVKSTE
jgi:hypothetical protein